jgi:hypothetical protein
VGCIKSVEFDIEGCHGRLAGARHRELYIEAVPRISAFYGIVIWMYRPDHPPPQFHVQYGEAWAREEGTEK